MSLTSVRNVLLFHISGGWGKEDQDNSFSLGAYVIRGTDIPNLRTGYKPELVFRYHTISNLKNRVLCPNDIIFEVSGGSKDQPVGRTLFITDGILNYYQGKVICASFCKLIRPDNKLVNPKFLYYFFQYIYQNRSITQWQVQSTGLSNFKFEIFLDECKIDLPERKVQDRIASILSAYDDLIENNTRRIHILEEMAQAVYREWFVHFRYPGHESVPLVESELGLIPQGWEVIPFTDLFESYSGGDWGSEQPDNDEVNPAIIIRGTDFKDVRSGGIIQAPKRFITSRSLARRCLKAGDIIVENSVNASSRCVGSSLLITPGILRRFGEDCICASFCKNFRLKNPDLAPLVYLDFKHLYTEKKMLFYQNIATNGIGNFQAERFVNSESLLLPSDPILLAKMVSILNNFTASVYADQIDNLRQQRDLLLPRLVSGELDVERLTVNI